MEQKQILRQALNCLEKNKPIALVTVVETSGSTPSRSGAKMIVYEEGEIEGTIGGGAIEAKVIEKAKEAMGEDKNFFLNYDLGNKEASQMGMVCGGSISVFIEPLLTGPVLLLVGAGHISQEISKLASRIGFQIVVVDDRPEFACEENFPQADSIYASDISQSIKEYPIDDSTYVVIVTRGHRHDAIALEEVINSPAKYIGMIGSKNKVRTILDDLREKGYPEEAIKKIYTPIGLDIGGDTPEEIAISIMAEIQQVRYKKGGENLAT